MKAKSLWLLLFFGFLLSSCSTISPYSPYAYTQDVNLKVDSIQLMNRAVESYGIHEKEVADLTTRIEKCYEYEKGRAKNEITTKMWTNMKDPNKDLLGGFFKSWKQKDTLKKGFIDEKSIQIGDDFDQIIGLESGKNNK